MIKHIVTWKLSATDDPGKQSSFDAVAAVLRPLADSVPSVRSLTVGRNVAYPDTNWDLVLVAEFDDLAGLEAYQVNPDHQAAAAVVRANVEARSGIDYEF